MRMTQQVLGKRVGVSKGLISHFEQGKRHIAASLASELDDALKAEGRLRRLHRELFAPDEVDWLGELARHQQEAEIIREYQRLHVPGNLQTEGYAAAIISSGAPWFMPDEVDDRAKTRMERAEQLLVLQTPHYHVVIDDAVVRRPLAPPEVMAEQCRHLLELMEKGRVLLQVYKWGQWAFPHECGHLMIRQQAPG